MKIVVFDEIVLSSKTNKDSSVENLHVFDIIASAPSERELVCFSFPHVDLLFQLFGS